MGETAVGGIYLSTDGVTFHDANGKPVAASRLPEEAKVKQPVTPIVVPLLAAVAMSPRKG